MSKLLESAYKYIKNNICVIGVNNEKRAFLPWKKFQDRIITKTEVVEHFEHIKTWGLAIICGKPSGNLEVIDIDVKYDLTGNLYNDYCQAVKDNNEELFNKLLIIQTISFGYHWYFKCTEIEGNQKLARRHTTEEELQKDPDDKIRVLIETRGQGGYVVAPPSEGYRRVSDTTEIPTITPEEREILFELARSFNQETEPPSKSYTNNDYNPKEYGLSPFEDYNKRGDVLDLLVRHGWVVTKEAGDKIHFRRPGKDSGSSGDYLISKQWFSVFTTSSVFLPNKAYLPYAVFAFLECNKDFKVAAKKLLDMGYGEKRQYYGDKIERELYKKKREGLDKEQMITLLVQVHKKEIEEARDIVEKLNKVWGEKICTFWDVDDRLKITINRTRLIEFLNTHGGFSLFYYDAQSSIFRIVRCIDGFVEEVSSEHIKKFIKGYIQSLPDTFDGGVTPEDLLELILKGSDSFLSKGILEFLDRSVLDFLKDTDKEAFFPFLNGVVRVSENKVTLVSYSEIKKVIWKSQVIDHVINIDVDLGKQDVEYSYFLNCISGKDKDRYNYACTLIGYLLHRHKDYSKPYAVILAEENDNEDKGGGTGKGIFITALSKFLNTERVDGKNFKLDKNFAFQRVGLDTKLIAIEDCRKNVDFEGFYSIITEGITVEKKNKDELFFPYKDSPKILFTTNYTISATGGHAKRRQKLFEFSGFFSAEHTPVMHFGHNLFEEWDIDEWNRFYNFGFICVQAFLENGILEVVATDKIKRKHIKLKYTEDFLEWFDEYSSNGFATPKLATDLYHEFLTHYELEKKEYAQTRFGRAINDAADSFGFEIIKGKNAITRRTELSLKKLNLKNETL